MTKTTAPGRFTTYVLVLILAATALTGCAADDLAESGGVLGGEVVPDDDPKADSESLTRKIAFPLEAHAPFIEYDVSPGSKHFFDGADVSMAELEAIELAMMFFSLHPYAWIASDDVLRVEVYRRNPDGTLAEQLEEVAYAFPVSVDEDGSVRVRDKRGRITNLSPHVYRRGDLLRVRISFIEGRLPPPVARAGKFLDVRVQFKFK